MLPGTIVMLVVIVVGFFGGTAMLIRKNLNNEKAQASSEGSEQ